MTTLETNTQPMEVWLSQPNLEVTCRIVFHDETATAVGVDSLSIRGAQSEITAWLIEQGYEPAGHWSAEDEKGRETARTFRRREPRHPAVADRPEATKTRSSRYEPPLDPPRGPVRLVAV